MDWSPNDDAFTHATPDLREVLQRHWGYASFRPFQHQAAEAAIQGRDALVVLPTGGGKSVCYQVPAACRQGLVVVVSPLIALMDDQVSAAQAIGLRAAALHSMMSLEQRSQVSRALRLRELDLVYVSPERLCASDLVGALRDTIALLAVDEAHCVSHWGHDFRPEYRQLLQVFDRAPHVPRMALTATATPQVQDDIVRQLGMRQPDRLVAHPDRPNLIYRSAPRRNMTDQILAVIKRHPQEGGIVYALTRKDVEQITTTLQGHGVDAATYHAGLEAAERQRVQTGFVNETIDVVVATIAFGMGIDRSNVRFVVHAACPKSIEHYQQESGRAGRDGDPAECVLLYAGRDFGMHRFLASKDQEPTPERLADLERHLAEIGRFAVAPVCRHRVLTEHFGQPYPAPDVVANVGAGADPSCGACDVCLGETKALDDAEALIIAQKIISAVWRTEGRFGAGHVIKVLLGKRDDQIERHRHEQLSVFGLLQAHDQKQLRVWVDQLIIQGHLAQERRDGFTFVVMTAAGRKLCRHEGSVRLSEPKRRASKRKAPAAKTVELAPGDETAFESLRVLRRQVAQQHHVPPYVVFTDATLRAMAQQRPTTRAALLALPGVGESRLERFGDAFLSHLSGDPAATANEDP